ncbi:major head protein [Desulfofustis phage LS06-2018-MD02]|jgi:HK97 family phage major capsid protein|nr:major head protein [Desulfofustis phage LS06-2018-MD02]
MKRLMQHDTGPLEIKDATGGDGGEGQQKKADTVEIKKALDGFSTTLDAFMKKTDDELKEMKKSSDRKSADGVTQDEVKKLTTALEEQKKLVENLRLENNRPIMTAFDGTKTQLTDEQMEHKKVFESWFRKGAGEEGLGEIQKKALSVGTDPDGGYTVPVQMETAIDRVITEISEMRRIARVVQVSTASYKKRVSMGGASSGWVGEQSARPNTSTPTLDVLEYPVMELYANPSATQSILDDSAISIDQWLADEVSIEFAVQEGSAFVNGNGAAKPRGFLTYDTVLNDNWEWGKLGKVITGVDGDWADSSSDPGAETTNIVDLVYSLKPVFRRNARFTMNRKTVSTIMKLRDAEGRQLWSSGLREGQPDRLLGYPIYEMEDMPDIGSDAYAIAFGDFQRGYIIVDRIGVRVLRDPFSAKPYVQFYTTKRVGGGIGHYEAIKLLQFAD